MPFEPKGKLPRRERHHYQGHGVVFWTNTLEERARGWLTAAFHATFREILLTPQRVTRSGVRSIA